MKEQIKVMVVDDHDMVRVGLRTYIMLDEELSVVEEASNGEEALRKLGALDAERIPDVILMDLTMPVMNGIEATREITQRFPSIKVIMLTSFLEEDKVVQAVEAGAISYVLKTISSEQLAHAVKGAAAGMPVLNPEVSLALTRGLRQRSSQTEDEVLTAREREVLSLISDGKSNKEIAEALHISIKTVKTHVSNLLMKCELDDRTQLAIYAHRKGWAGTGA
ncbi:DNA-binding response regulator [Paenibacillus chitinolyticus]|uniref:DNA-binding response regulator n=1 Tax=Paenibacillus chitinolyticus TaxID=79263 RepID=A0A410WSZ8_9BACL|nr:response regulator transcription factor [Paenibacillus chitinolyticus]MCY9588788.1 response regulator transcription factor [Paenibacillus chitinolyticus]MCY9595708.1 response regulator transcription factor [Paenibacillus chitinolyticus]QAV17464.1 DNA-binding response regulator [Paenibacillus chitinolyticus]